jgi:hypothetical protein
VGELADAVADSIAALDLAARDRGAAALAHALACEIDDAKAAERFATKALKRARDEDDPEIEEVIRALRAKVGHRDAIVRCGQRLESVLIALGAAPSARAKTATPTPASFGGPLAVLRGGAAGVTG